MRHHRPLALAALTALLLTGCGGGDGDQGPSPSAEDTAADDQSTTDPEAELATTVLMTGADGEDVGTVDIVDDGEIVRISVDAQNLTPGFHGFHLHAVPECHPDAEDGPFTTAEGHWSLGGEDHGAHAGDLPPLLVLEDGTADASFVTDRFTMADVEENGGVAIMIHEGPDNLANIPDRYTAEGADAPGPDEDTLATGDAGGRAACGVLEPGEEGEDELEDEDEREDEGEREEG
jgi:superoxide dismutase, Cu-Zn family